MIANRKGIVLAIILLMSTPLVLQAETTALLLGSARRVTGRGSTSSHGAGMTNTSSTYYYQSVHTKGIGTAGGTRYCVDHVFKAASHRTSVSVSAPLTSHSGYHVSKHSWYDAWDNHWSGNLYTSHTGQHSTLSHWSPPC